MRVPEIAIGILSSESGVSIRLNGAFSIEGNPGVYEGVYTVKAGRQQRLILSAGQEETEADSPLLLKPVDEDTASFDIEDVIIGVEFHWERKERQRFKGNLKLIAESEKITVVNILSVEEYLLSVISSEMKATSSVELLKAHAVISRSWVLAQIEKSLHVQKRNNTDLPVDDEVFIRWYDREDHNLFDVCADDHCQRYQGVSRTTTREVDRAVRATSGEVLMSDGKLCDTRFSKCCGGITESFENVWEPVGHSYLRRVVDCDMSVATSPVNLKDEQAARAWILDTPPAFCNTKDKTILSQVLNDYDLETADFYRWEVVYTQQELSRLITKKTGWDFGKIVDLVPVERGDSGRLIRLKIVGTEKIMTIGKELFIRKAMAESHLYSSAFIIEKEDIVDGIPQSFVLKGAGWGHGVGLCQIGAAIMGERGYTYKQILEHYFAGAELYKSY